MYTHPHPHEYAYFENQHFEKKQFCFSTSLFPLNFLQFAWRKKAEEQKAASLHSKQNLQMM